MRLLVMFDLPTGSKSERKSYATFRKFLIDDGYHMEQYSIYSRVTLSRENMQSHIDRLRANIPEAGLVMAIQLTEKQFENREILVNSIERSNSPDIGSQMTLIF